MQTAPALGLVALCSISAVAQTSYPVERLLGAPAREAGVQGFRRREAPTNFCGPEPGELIHSLPLPENSSFGERLDLSGERLIVGDPYYDGPAGQEDVGTAYFFEREQGEWLARGQFTMPVGIDGRFGFAVAVDGDFALASAPFFRSYHGEVFIFRRTAGVEGVAWAQSGNLKPNPDDNSVFFFGEDVEIDGTTLAVSGLFSSAEPNGWVEIYEYTNDAWRKTGHVRPPTGSIFDDFGRCIALSDGRLIVGAPYHVEPTYEGAAYIYRKDDAGWTLEADLTPPDLQPNDLAGWQVAIDGELAAVATPFTAGSAPKVWLYRLGSEGWKFDGAIAAPLDNSYAESDFARSIHLQGGTLIVGAPYAEIWGATYVYRRYEGGWALMGRVRFDDVSTPTQLVGDLGRAVAVQGNLAVASAPYSTVLETRSIVTGFVQTIDLSTPVFSITRQPLDVQGTSGETASFSVEAIGPGALSYQWFKGSTPVVDGGRISGAGTPTLVLTDLVIEDSALYSVRISSAECGAIESAIALLDLGTCIDVASAPGPLTLVAGEPLIMECDVSGILPLTFQWTRSGDDLVDDGRITGSTTPTLVIDPTLPEDQAAYRLRIMSQCGETLTNEAGVNFQPCSTITLQPEDLYTFVGDTLRLETGSESLAPLTYQWWRNGAPLSDGGRFSGSNTSVLTIAPSIALDAARYRCTVSCGFNEQTSREAVVVLNAAGCLGDANNDRRVNMVDLSTVLQSWGVSYRPLTGSGDADRDGIVGFNDLTMVLSRYGAACE